MVLHQYKLFMKILSLILLYTIFFQAIKLCKYDFVQTKIPENWKIFGKTYIFMIYNDLLIINIYLRLF